MSDAAPFGIDNHWIGAEIPKPSTVYRSGIGLPLPNARLVSPIDSGS
jgi:hypothetical protein